ncbi:MAG: fatty acid metabolism transcriptional regulator FadR [Anaerolineaceae bacterium]
MNWNPPEKPTDFTEKRLIEAILQNVYPAETFLPSERDLCKQLGVTRPTLRETLQRMRQDGWVEIHQGKPTRVCNYLQEGNLNVLNAIANANVEVSFHVVESLLEIRLLLAPSYFSRASQYHPQTLILFLQSIIPISTDPKKAGHLDWDLHKKAALLSNNPVFLLILNGFDQVYLQMAEKYFDQAAARSASEAFYHHVLQFTQEQAVDSVFQCTKEMMQSSIQFWKSSVDSMEEK